MASNLLDGLQNAPIDLPLIGALKGAAKWFGIGSDAVETTAQAAATTTTSTGGRVFNGIELNPNLPPPIAGWDYSPSMLKGPSENQIWSHWTGYQGEINLANTVAGLPNETVVRWGDAIGTNGNDIISVNQATGQVTLWDNKFRNDVRGLKDPSATFDPGSANLSNALEQAERAIDQSALPSTVKVQALTNLRSGNFVTNTVGSGGLKNSFHIRFCGGSPC
jgi:filamentous hemagglutinin